MAVLLTHLLPSQVYADLVSAEPQTVAEIQDAWVEVRRGPNLYSPAKPKAKEEEPVLIERREVAEDLQKNLLEMEHGVTIGYVFAPVESGPDRFSRANPSMYLTIQPPRLPTRHVLSNMVARKRELEFDRAAGRRLGPITDLPNEPYEVIQSIPVAYTFFAADDVMASFDEADICCVEDSYEAALDGLKAAILTTFEVYSENEGRLDKRPQRCLEVLRQYVRPTA